MDKTKLHSTFLDTADDMQWLQNVHNAPNTVQSAVLYGNEDCPTLIEGFASNKPTINDKPVWTKKGN